MAATLTEQKPDRAKAKRERGEQPWKKPKPPKAAKPPRPPRSKDKAREKPARQPKGHPASRAEDWGDPVKPALNLLPLKARGARERRKATRGALLVSAGLVAVAAVGYASLIGAGAVAQGDLERAQLTGQAHQAELGKYQQVQDYAAGIDDRKEAAASALDQDIAYSSVLAAVSSANTVGASFDSISNVADPAGCPAPNPFSPSLALGCLQLSGTAPSPLAVGQLVTAMGADPSGVLTAPYATESGAGDKGTTTFKISVGFTDKALSHRGQKFTPVTGGAASATPSPAQPKESTK